MEEVVGRTAELDAIGNWLDRPRPPILLLEGEAGIGKTTLWRVGVDEARARGERVLVSASVQSETQLSFTTIRDLVGEIFDEVADELPTPQRHALAVTLLREAPAGRPPDRGAIGVAFLSALRVLGKSTPTLIAVDDVQWMDAASQVPLRYALRRLGTEQTVSALLAHRIDETSALPLELDRLDPSSIHTLEIGPLSVGALGRILHSQLETTYPRPTLLRLHQVSGGNPFFALELARALGRITAPIGVRTTLPVPGTLHELVDERLVSLPSKTQDALLVAAALSRPTLDLLEVAFECDPLPLLAPAAEAQVARADGTMVRFAHPLYAAAVYDLAAADRRRETHRRLAEVVADDEEHARHLALSADEPSEPVAAVVESAAQLAAARGASAAAAELLEEAHRLTPAEDVIGRSRRAIDAGWCQFIAGNTARAGTLLERASETAPAGALHARALVRLAWLDHHTGDRRVALDLYRAALEEAVDDPVLQAETHSLLAWCLFIMREDVALAARYARKAVELCETIEDPVLLADSLAVLAQVEFFLGGGLPSATMERALGIQATVIDQRVLRQPRQHWALLLLCADRFDEARSHLQFVRELADAHGDESALPWPLMRLSQLELLAGDWVRAIRYADTGLEVALETGQRPPQADLLCTRALVLAHMGRVEEARAAAEEGIQLAESCGAGIGRRLAQWALALLDLSRDSIADAHDRLETLRAASQAAGIVDPGENRYLGDLGESLVGLGRMADADLLADELEARGTALQRSSALAVAWRVRGLAALERGDVDAALEALEQALDHHRLAPLPFDQARTLLALGAAQRRARQRRSARETLGSAVAIFEELGAELWAVKARAELGRIGGRAASSGGLTQTEQRVADLVSEGKSNKEVASELVVSVHTVEAALTSIYRKLEIHSRTELAHRLATSASKQ